MGTCRFSIVDGCWDVPLGRSWVDGTIYFFDNSKKVDEAQIKLCSSSYWSVSHVDIDIKVYSYFDICFVPFYECLFTRLKSRFLFSKFEEELLKRMNISPPNCTSLPRPLLRYFNISVNIKKKCPPLTFSSICLLCSVLINIPIMGKRCFISPDGYDVWSLHG